MCIFICLSHTLGFHFNVSYIILHINNVILKQNFNFCKSLHLHCDHLVFSFFFSPLLWNEWTQCIENEIIISILLISFEACLATVVTTYDNGENVLVKLVIKDIIHLLIYMYIYFFLKHLKMGESSTIINV